MRRPLALMILCIPLAAAPAAEAITLTPLGRTAALGETRAEIAAFDPATQRVFATNAGDNRLDIYDFSDPSAPALIEKVDLSPFGGGPNSVDVSRKGLVAVAVEAGDVTAPGSVEFFDTDGDHLGSIPAGALPDMLTFAQHDRYLLVANEGEAASGDDDPKGSVTVIRLHKDLDKASVRTATFDGVPTVGPVRIACPDATFAEDAEPEYIAEGPLGTALVTLQENNAVGVLSLPLGRFLAVRALGFKNHGLPRNAFDPSDRDNAIAINPWANVFGMYQPDAIAAYTHRGIPYYVAANEGDAREREGCEEETRVSALTLDPGAFPAGVQANDKLGRLNVTSTMGDNDGDGDFDRLFPFGGRSMSILGPLGGLVFDTGSELERIAAAEQPAIFNASN
jgi:2',3'-cyclic-nucleotide 2'-phosphodiesterase / 3'-nucleotidase / 5'-nucleotidase